MVFIIGNKIEVVLMALQNGYGLIRDYLQGFCIFISFLVKKQGRLMVAICNTKISTPGALMVVGRHVQSGEKFELPKAHVPNRLNRSLPASFQLSCCRLFFSWST